MADQEKLICQQFAVIEKPDNLGRIVLGEAEDGRIVLGQEIESGKIKMMVNPFTLKQGAGLASQVLAGNPQALTRPTAILELAAYAIALEYALNGAAEQANKETDDG